MFFCEVKLKYTRKYPVVEKKKKKPFKFDKSLSEFCLKFDVERVGAVVVSGLWGAAAPSLSLRADAIAIAFTFLHTALSEVT